MNYEPSQAAIDAATKATGTPLFTARQMRAALIPAHEVEDGWRPIETAPKDGTRIMVAYKGGVTIATFLKDAAEYEDDHGPHFVEFDCDDHFYSSHLVDKNAPTHWRPLPAPPAIDGVL